jgi:hypothetical protein
VWLIGQVGRAMSATTGDQLGTAWFGAHLGVMAGLAAAVIVPMACSAAIQAVYRQSASMLLRTFLVHLPLALLLTGVAVTLVRMSLGVTDALSSRVMSSAGVDTTNLFSGMADFFTAVGGEPVVPAFVVFVSALVVALAALVLWLELVVRAAAVSAAVLFLPLALAALVWPAVAHWCRRLADTIAALVLSKLVIAAVISLAVAAVAGGTGASGGTGGGGFGAVMTGMALLVIATVAPFSLLRLVPAVEAGAVAHLESARHRLQSVAHGVGSRGNLALDEVRRRVSPSREGEEESTGTGGEGTGALAKIPQLSGQAAPGFGVDAASPDAGPADTPGGSPAWGMVAASAVPGGSGAPGGSSTPGGSSAPGGSGAPSTPRPAPRATGARRDAVTTTAEGESAGTEAGRAGD